MRRGGIFMVRRSLFVLVALAGLSAFARASQQPILLGILEDVPAQTAGSWGALPNLPGIRLVFEKRDGEWRAFPPYCGKNETCYPRHAVTWTITFDGGFRGQVTGLPVQAPARGEPRWYGEEHQKTLGPVPTVGRRAQEFSGWLWQPLFRPLVACSRPYYRDPDAWKPSPASHYQVGAMIAQYRRRFPQKLESCKERGHDESWRPRDGDFQLTKSYASRSGYLVAGLYLEAQCDDLIIDPSQADPFTGADPFTPQWYLLTPEGEISFLGQNLRLLDAGDYDDDGQSEVVFSVEGYNLGGYAIFYDHFAKKAVYQFHYH
jgi:hypothetical protein